jgi:hypothetical protein
MDVIKLRTLTLKSSLGYGKYGYYTIDDIITLDSEYLRWVYYHSSKVNFTSDILELLGIDFEHTIPKPGRSEEMFIVNKAHIKHKIFKSINEDGDWGEYNKIKKNTRISKSISNKSKYRTSTHKMFQSYDTNKH